MSRGLGKVDPGKHNRAGQTVIINTPITAAAQPKRAAVLRTTVCGSRLRLVGLRIISVLSEPKRFLRDSPTGPSAWKEGGLWLLWL